MKFEEVFENAKARLAGRKRKVHNQMKVVVALKKDDDITKDKRYLVSDENDDSFTIRNDKDNLEIYPKSNFELVDQMSGRL